ncbi:MAG: hypothetical protein ACUVXF_05605 [Desulfobaccales bacterium]
MADLEGGRKTSDAGGLLLREVDQRYRVAEQAAACLHDPRDSDKVRPKFYSKRRFFVVSG